MSRIDDLLAADASDWRSSIDATASPDLAAGIAPQGSAHVLESGPSARITVVTDRSAIDGDVGASTEFTVAANSVGASARDRLGGKRRTSAWQMMAAAVVVLIAASGLFAVRWYHDRSKERPSEVATCLRDFGSAKSRISGPLNLNINLIYSGSSACAVSALAPRIVLQSVRGEKIGAKHFSQDQRLGKRTVMVHPGDTYSFRIRGFLACQDIPDARYNLLVVLQGGAGETATVTVPLGLLTGSSNLCVSLSDVLGFVGAPTVASP